jgi:hypothetical protein
VDSGLQNPEKDASFIRSVSGIVNRGCHNPDGVMCGTVTPAGSGEHRAHNFCKVLKAMNLLSAGYACGE